MGWQKDKLTAKAVAALKTPGRYSDGDRLYVSVIQTPAGTISRHWVFQYTFGRQREMRLGPADIVTLAEAREKARECRIMIARGLAARREESRQ